VEGSNPFSPTILLLMRKFILSLIFIIIIIFFLSLIVGVYFDILEKNFVFQK
ncbi:MAG: hypothetical protein CFH14_00749, partial [Alphaproteobacteria bacterium MarineAlpha5_Bin4]